MTFTSPPVPEDMEIEIDWRAPTGAGDTVTVEHWRNRGRRRSQIRILRGPILGEIEQDASGHPVITPDAEAVEQYGEAWVGDQLKRAHRHNVKQQSWT
ncbi:hypothetical protein [Glycomyces paridis]|uniref:Uncharacterized protein n=1 Tax=Glycomyces paridis TaxID=2126555 RepID=A0A4S8PCA8_9ACTN|nr:hypothetical protein [Glycomyces paridis]THV27958.1 hypothetical protein E9998_13285 [Glycomyces paridis]